MRDAVYTLSPQWKEELVCTCAAGRFVLQFDMGVPTVYFPTAARWPSAAPAWAATHWQALHDQLVNWCKFNNAALVVEDRAPVY